jgi:hypothetical protein
MAFAQGSSTVVCRFASIAALATALLGIAGPSRAGDYFVGVYDHAVFSSVEGGEDIMLGYRTDPIRSWTWLARPSVGITVSANTRVPTDFVAVGLNWPLTIAYDGRLYVRPGFGVAYTNGEAGIGNAADLTVGPVVHARREHLVATRIDFGSHEQFEPELAFGFKFTPRWAIEASYVHLSNGQIFHHGKNQGLDDPGLRMAYRF